MVAIDVRCSIYLTSNSSDVGRFQPVSVICVRAMVVNGWKTEKRGVTRGLAWTCRDTWMASRCLWCAPLRIVAGAVGSLFSADGAADACDGVG